ncbi:uncharacterized protein LOC144007860 isoform X4 [Festucalex cinctus]
MAPPVQMVQSIRHDQLVSNMNANCTFQSKFLQSRRLLAGLSVLFKSVPTCLTRCFNRRLIIKKKLSAKKSDCPLAMVSTLHVVLQMKLLDAPSGRRPPVYLLTVKVGQACAQLQIFSLILHPQGSKKCDELPENAAVWKPFQKTTCLGPSSCSWLTS